VTHNAQFSAVFFHILQKKLPNFENAIAKQKEL